jgi:hypothetical protein
MSNPNYPVLTREQKRRKQAIRNWKRSQKQLVEYCCKAQECFQVLRNPQLNTEAQEYVPEDGVEFFDVQPVCDFLFIDDDKYWGVLDANRLTAEKVAEFCLA